MTKWIAILLVSCVSVACSVCTAADVGIGLQATSVNIKAGSSEGSGTVVLRKVGAADTAFVVTAAHVVEGLRQVNDQIVNGEKRQHVTYRDAQVVQEVSTTTGDRIVGDSRLDAKILSVDHSRDIAVLQLRAIGTLRASATFFAGKDVPAVGTEIYHCGAPGGQDTGGTATLTAGIVSRTGVRIPDFGGSDHGIFDQTDCAGLPGSSGGMVCRRANGEWIGMITLGLQGAGNFHWFVPIRNVREFCEQAKCKWLLDGGEVSTADLATVPIELYPPRGCGGLDAHGETRQLPIVKY